MVENNGEICQWVNNLDLLVDSNVYLTGCGEEFYLNEGRPIDNGFEFCCFCGKVIEVVGD